MRKMTVALLAICLSALCVQAGTGRSGKVKPFNSAEWQTSFADAFNKKNANLVKKHLSRIYNVTGESRDDVARRLDKAFQGFDRVALEYNILDVKQPAPGHAVLKISSVLKGVRSGTRETVVVSEKQGFDSLVYEEGSWRMFDSVAAASRTNRELGAGMELFAACPDVAFSGAVQARASESRRLIRAGAFVQSQTFDPRAWEARVNRAWDSKDVALVGNLYSALYSHAGYDKNDVLTQTAKFFNQFGNITSTYRVLSFTYIGSGLVSVQANIQIHAEPVGGGASTLIFQTAGYGSLKNEGGVWRLYATQPPA